IVGEDGVNSTTGDLLIWDLALYHNPLIGDSSLTAMFTSGSVDSGVSDYGFGWFIRTFPPYGRIAYHSGGWPGYMAYIERHLDNDKTVIVLRNKFISEPRLPIDAIRAVLYNRPVNSPAGITVPAEILAKYAGTYRLAEHYSVVIALRNGGGLTLQGTNQPAFTLMALTNTTFYFQYWGATLQFIAGPSGEVGKLIVHQRGGQTAEGTREK